MKPSRPVMYTATLVALLTMATGCEVDDLYDNEAIVGTVATLTNGIAIHRTDANKIFYLDANLKKPTLTELFTPADGEQIVWLKAGPEPDQPSALFVLTAPEDQRNTKIDERLYRVNAANGKKSTYTVGSSFDQIVFGPREKFAILYHGEKNVEQGLYNPNEISLIDLTKKAGKKNPQTLSVSMDGRKIDMVAFVPSIHVGGVERELAVFLAGSIARIVDLNDPEGTWAKVPLLPKSDTRTVTPKQLIAVDEAEGCDNAACEAKLFIRLSNSEDIYYITLGRGEEGFVEPQTKQLEAGGVPSDMAIVSDDGVAFLAAISYANGTTKVNFVNIDTSEPFNIVVNDRLTRMTHLEGDELHKLVLFGESGYRGVYFLSLDDIAVEKGRNLEQFALQGSVTVTVPLDENQLLLIPNSGQDLVILDLITEKGERLSSSGEYNWHDAEIFEDIFFVLPNANSRVDFFDLSTGSPDTLLLDDQTTDLYLVRGRKTGIAFHNTPSGRVTLFPLNNPIRAKAKVLDGLWLAECLNNEGSAK
jgi:hypothetical protein